MMSRPTMSATLAVALMILPPAAAQADCSATSFPNKLADTMCFGLKALPRNKMGAPITSQAACLSACCEDPSCTVYQFAPVGTPRGSGCWVLDSPASPSCTSAKGWNGGQGRGYTPPPPPPPPGAPLKIQLPAAGPVAKPLPYSFNASHATSPSGEVLGADSISLTRKLPHQAAEPWFAIGGEVHLARLPSFVWKEQLMRMKAGGLNMIAVYVFWIHHEEERGVFNFSGRRDIRAFVQLADQVGLKVLMRIGPWDHGECRNGGHPDWVLTSGSCGSLRSTDPKYLGCVSGWYTALATQLAGLYHKDGGPVILVQVDNETRDWKYLLALRQLAMSLGILPASFTKTGWPGPAAGYPSDYPMLPFFGGYADAFWGGMSSMANAAEYVFTSEPQAEQEAQEAAPEGGGDDARTYMHVGSGGWSVPQGYPWLDIEIGGGMAADYRHRVNLDSADMPSMHLCDVGVGVNTLGYYMYHGGNNPHSTVHTHDMDDPRTTLQESSFQPAGAANPMPSITYDFFAPLGEFGQPRRHYHQMRRLHNTLRHFGPQVAATTPTWPWESGVAAPGDNATLRWVVRRGDPGQGSFVFINNYERLVTLPPKERVRLQLDINGSSGGGGGHSIAIPSAASPALVIESGVWAMWPLDMNLLSKQSAHESLLYATAQLVARVQTNQSNQVLFLLETAGVAAEVAFSNGQHMSATPGVATLSLEGGGTTAVFRDITAGTTAFTYVRDPVTASTIQVVLLPLAWQDRIYIHPLMGVCGTGPSTCDHLMIHLTADMDGPNSALLAVDTPDVSPTAGAIHLRRSATPPTPPGSGGATESFLSCPPLFRELKQGRNDVLALLTPGEIFTSYSSAATTLPSPGLADPTITRVRPAGPPRNASHTEPTIQEWREGAAVYNLTLSVAVPSSAYGDFKLAIDYIGDAARVYYGTRLLTDNWWSGYNSSREGAMEVGLSYLAQENPGLLEEGATLSLWILPLTRASLETDVYLQKRLWPAFPASSSTSSTSSASASVLKLNSVKMGGLIYTDLTMA